MADTKASSTPIEHMARIERFVNEMRGINPVGAEFVDPSVARVREALERAPAGVGGPRIDDGHALCPACSTRLRIVHAESGRVQLRMRLADAPVGGDAPMSGQASGDLDPEGWLAVAFVAGWHAHEDASGTEGIGGAVMECAARFQSWVKAHPLAANIRAALSTRSEEVQP